MPEDTTKIAPCLWFDGNAEEAANFYASIFPDTLVGKITRCATGWPVGNPGDAITVEFTLFGSPYLGLNGGPEFTFNEAISLQIYTDTQEETDRYWSAIVDNDGAESMCGWCSDRYGLHWQIAPRALLKAIGHPDPALSARAMAAMMTMKKIDIAAIEAAVRGVA